MGFLQSHDLAEHAQESNFHKEIEKDGSNVTKFRYMKF